ncbi:hypothetical protein GCK72_019647 [Caenorhabditis remanei]|uniref:Uncharacterized protein n=1 Tax=Caenorhabditis remanei TaxID=31234 RepID=A0A6A5GES1_CAERE|nr:hypothetical protein GCK72_019647 [Caenorhabditis remanei]KAF1753091.1 hypothetical protein GCK72_019647 [Caenorhabditis remanei]
MLQNETPQHLTSIDNFGTTNVVRNRQSETGSSSITREHQNEAADMDINLSSSVDDVDVRLPVIRSLDIITKPKKRPSPEPRLLETDDDSILSVDEHYKNYCSYSMVGIHDVLAGY